MRSLTISVTSYKKISNFGDFYKIIFFANPYLFFIFTKFWTFWEVVFFQSHFTVSLLRSAIFWEKSTFFFRKPTIFFHQKTWILNVFRIFAFSVAFYWNYATFTVFFKQNSCFRRTNFFFAAENLNFLTFRGNLLIQFFSRKSPNCWTFWEVLLSQCHCSANLLLLATPKQSRILSKTHLYFFQQKT